ncbi:RHS repeat domain-containing protein [Fictibacillus sp. 18YEL24]|uniref:RHS repeat domain-containing protein n=1 Tax=Fictibacillus sp. 18YEL24 TaxID=2745875 RepID=UPI0018CF762F|nr:RHS repeat-associated core domain-containing protein [Fictibacillus sp. 18YEL24]MBH0171447.1 hypothetical protein [Fictibacillus sp. 18YEL24]
MIKVDNLTSGKVKETYTYATGNRISQKKDYNDTTGTLIRTTNYTFNANGALAKAQITEGSQTNTIDYTYNNDDQLIKIIKNINGTQTSILYEYDQDGNRLAKTVNGVHQHYHRDTNGEIFKVTTETANGSQTMFNVYKDADGNLLSFRYNDSLYYYQFNARGDVIAITDPAGTVIATYDYDEWGNITSITGNQEVANANPYRYVGKYGVIYDKNANTYLIGWRDYDPTTGRFIVPDEYEGEEDEPTSLNRYLYAEGDPVNNIDPDGHLPKWMQKGWKSTKKYSKKAYNFAAGDDIRKLRSKKSKWYQKAGAGASIASNFVPGVGAAKWGAKAGIKALKYGKKAKKIKKFPASSIKKTRKHKIKSKTTYKKTYSNRSYTAKKVSKRSKAKQVDKGLASRGYKPSAGERTLKNYVNNNVPKNKETKLFTKSSRFNNVGSKGGQFKRYGTDSPAGLAPHVHQPIRNAHNGKIRGGVGSKTKNGGVTYPTKRDVKQLYQYINNGKYRQ